VGVRRQIYICAAIFTLVAASSVRAQQPPAIQSSANISQYLQAAAAGDDDARQWLTRHGAK
jgi:hypothetical protein